MKKLTVALSLTVAGSLAVAPGEATTIETFTVDTGITSSTVVPVSGTANVPLVTPFILPSFDPALGNLVSVGVSYDGTLSASLSGGVSVVDQGPGGIVPVPYSYTVELSPSLTGNNFAFHLGVPEPLFGATGVVNTIAGASAVYGMAFDYDFTFDATTDLTGLAPVASSVLPTALPLNAPLVSPAFASGLTSAFADPFPAPTIGQLDFGVFAIASPLTTPLVVDASLASTLSVTYTYEAARAAAEPSSLWLVGVGVFAARARRRKEIVRS